MFWVGWFFFYYEAKLENKFFNSLKCMFLRKISTASSGSALSYSLYCKHSILEQKKVQDNIVNKQIDMKEDHKFSIINRKHKLWTICPRTDLHSLSFHCCFWGWFGVLFDRFFKYPFSGYLTLSPLNKIGQLFLKGKIRYKSQKSVSSSHLRLSGISQLHLICQTV